MASVTITLNDEDGGIVIAAAFDPAPTKEALQSHSAELTKAQHVALHLMEMLESANGGKPIEHTSTVLVQRDDPRYKL